METTDNGVKSRLQNETVYAVRKQVSGEGRGTTGQNILDTFQTRLQGLYCQDKMAGRRENL